VASRQFLSQRYHSEATRMVGW